MHEGYEKKEEMTVSLILERDHDTKYPSQNVYYDSAEYFLFGMEWQYKKDSLSLENMENFKNFGKGDPLISCVNNRTKRTLWSLTLDCEDVEIIFNPINSLLDLEESIASWQIYSMHKTMPEDIAIQEHRNNVRLKKQAYFEPLLSKNFTMHHTVSFPRDRLGQYVMNLKKRRKNVSPWTPIFSAALDVFEAVYSEDIPGSSILALYCMTLFSLSVRDDPLTTANFLSPDIGAKRHVRLLSRRSFSVMFDELIQDVKVEQRPQMLDLLKEVNKNFFRKKAIKFPVNYGYFLPFAARKIYMTALYGPSYTDWFSPNIAEKSNLPNLGWKVLPAKKDLALIALETELKEKLETIFFESLVYKYKRVGRSVCADHSINAFKWSIDDTDKRDVISNLIYDPTLTIGKYDKPDKQYNLPTEKRCILENRNSLDTWLNASQIALKTPSSIDQKKGIYDLADKNLLTFKNIFLLELSCVTGFYQ